MTTENLSVIRIHRLTQDQYAQSREADTLEPNALYLTPAADYLTEQSICGNARCRKWAGGFAEQWLVLQKGETTARLPCVLKATVQPFVQLAPAEAYQLVQEGEDYTELVLASAAVQTVFIYIAGQWK